MDARKCQPKSLCILNHFTVLYWRKLYNLFLYWEMKTLRTYKQLIRSIYSAHKAVFLLFKRRSENSKARKNGVSHRKYKDWGASAGRNISLCTLDIYTTTFWNIRALLGLQVFLAHGLFYLIIIYHICFPNSHIS